MNNKGQKLSLREHWTKGDKPYSFGGINTVEKYFPKLSRPEIQDALAGIDTYTIHREKKQPKVYNPIYVRKPRELLQADLIEITGDYPAENDGVRFLLVVIDSFTRFAWIEPLKRKEAKEVLSAYKRIHSRMGQKEKSLLADQGKEFQNKLFWEYLYKQGIELRKANNKAPHVERFNRTYQNILYRWMEEHQTKRYINHVQKLLYIYNNRSHRTIKMSPAEAEKPENFRKVLSAVEQYYKQVKKDASLQNQKPKFKIGDHVRISAYNMKFDKGYYQQFKPYVYEVSEILTHLPVTMYKIKHRNSDKKEVGTWYENELQKVSQDYDGTVFKIERIIKTKGTGSNKKALVKWKYWNDEDSTWEPYSAIKDIIPK